VADLDEGFFEVEPGKTAEKKGEGESEDGNGKVAPGFDEGEAAKKHAEKKLVEQVSAVSNEAQSAEPTPAQAAAEPHGGEKQSVKEKQEVGEGHPSEPDSGHERLIRAGRAPAQEEHTGDEKIESKRQEAAMGEEPSAAEWVAKREGAENAEEKGVRAARHERVPGKNVGGVVMEEKSAKKRRGDNGNENETKEGAAVQKANQQRKSEVKLLFDGERPGDAEGENAPSAAKRHGEILEKKDEGRPRQGSDEDLLVFCDEAGARKIDGESDGGKQDGVDGNDAKETAGVEDAEIVGGLAGVQKDAADEEAGKDKEEGDAGPGGAGRKEGVGEGRAGAHNDFKEVSEKDQADGDAADAVKLGDAAGEIEREGFAEAFAVNRCLSRSKVR